MTRTTKHAEVVIVGAGIVGLATAWYLQQRGHGVVLVDPEEPGSGASSGNAGTFAPYGVLPLAQPGIWRTLPGLLMSPESPFSLNWRHLPRLSPWLVRFLRASNRTKAERGAEVLSLLLGEALGDWSVILDDLDAGSLISGNGALYFFRDARNWRNARGEVDARARFGIRQETLDGYDIGQLEPALKGRAAGAVFFPDAWHVSDPFHLAQRLAQRIKVAGGEFLKTRVVDLEKAGNHILVYTPEGPVAADHVVVAAGAWSRPLAKSLGDDVPLDTERGYHVEFPGAADILTRPCCPVEHAFYMTPMDGRLRVAGTVELGRLGDAPNPARLAFIRRHVENLMGDLGEPGHTWLGHRPSMPDSVPVIGPSPNTDRVTYAFGHGHLGLTLAARTGRLVTMGLHGERPDWLAGCNAGRFH